MTRFESTNSVSQSRAGLISRVTFALLIFSIQAMTVSRGVLANEFTEVRELTQKKKWSEAAIVLKKMVAENPQSVELLVELSKVLIVSDRREEAVSRLVEAAGKFPKHRAALNRRAKVAASMFLNINLAEQFRLGVHHLTAGEYSAAKSKFEHVYKEDPKNGEILLRLGQNAVMDLDYDTAAEYLERADVALPKDPVISLWLGRALHQKGVVDKALVELKSAYDQKPSDEQVVCWYADALVSAGQAAKAQDVLLQDTRQHTEHLQSILNLVKLRMSQSAKPSTEGLWNSRRDLQVILSRAASGAERVTIARDSLDWDLPTIRIQDVVKDAKTLLEKLSSRLENKEKESGT